MIQTVLKALFLAVVAAFAVLAGIIASSPAAFSQTAGVQQVSVAWSRPLSYVDSTAVPATATVTYNLYTGGAGAETLNIHATNSSYTTATFDGGAPGSTFCVVATATVNGGPESDKTPEVCVTMDAVVTVAKKAMFLARPTVTKGAAPTN